MTELLKERLMDRVEFDTNGGCWLWRQSTHGGGYGKVGKKSRSAHRVSYEVFNGPIGDGLCVCHKCDVRCCINPAHLFLGTQKENCMDTARKGRIVSNTQTKLSRDQVAFIRDALASHETQSSIACRFGVSPSYISLISNGKRRRK